MANKGVAFGKNAIPKYPERGLVQQRDYRTESSDDMKPVTEVSPTAEQITDLIFANKIVKHSKSNAIVLAKNRHSIAAGAGETSRVDALKQPLKRPKLSVLHCRVQ